MDVDPVSNCIKDFLQWSISLPALYLYLSILISAGKSEVSAIVYKAGECMQELLKSWKEFEATPDARNAENQKNVPTLEIRIPAEFVTSTNRQVSVLMASITFLC
jgi:hypothetical protein